MQSNDNPLVFTHRFTLTAGDCDCARRMPLPWLLRKVIETATLHANRLGIGYRDLAPMGIVWVLSRVTMRVDRYPGPNEDLSLTTWVQDATRLYSTRCMTLSDADGKPMAHITSMWVCINITERTAADISALGLDRFVSPGIVCPLPRTRKLPVVALDGATMTANRRFEYSDVDFNGHVNSARYAECVLDLWTPETYQKFLPAEFVINYLHECRYGQTAVIAADERLDSDTGTMNATVTLRCDDKPCVNVAIRFEPAQ